MATSDSQPPKRNRNEFVRTEISLAERGTSVVILCLIAGVGFAVWFKGRHFDPALYSVRTDSLKSTVATVEGKSGTIRGEAAQARGVVRTATVNPAAIPAEPSTTRKDAPGEGGYEESSANKSAPAAGEPLEIPLPGLKPMGQTEFYNADNLFEKIDGRAPAYVGFNFQNLRCRSFGLDGTAGSYVDVYEYRMDTPINAFGIFALERDPKGKPLDFAADGYASEMGFFFRQGAVYVQLLCSDQNPGTLAAGRAIAENRAKALPADDAGLAARRELPAGGMVADSVTFVPENAIGQSFLNNVFQADYNFAGQKLTFFLMAATPDATAEAWKSFLAFSDKYGGTATELPSVAGAKIFSAQNFGKFKIIYQREGEIGGIIDATDAGAARQFVEKYLAGEIK